MVFHSGTGSKALRIVKYIEVEVAEHFRNDLIRTTLFVETHLFSGVQQDIEGEMDERFASVKSGSVARVLQLCEAGALGVGGLQRRRVQITKKGLCDFWPSSRVENPVARAVIQPANLTSRRAIGARKFIRRQIKSATGDPVQPLTFASIQGLTPERLVLRVLYGRWLRPRLQAPEQRRSENVAPGSCGEYSPRSPPWVFLGNPPRSRREVY